MYKKKLHVQAIHDLIAHLLPGSCVEEIHLLVVFLKPGVKNKYNRQYNDLLKAARPIKALPRTQTATKKI